MARIVAGMTVAQLIEELQKQNPDAPIWGDGCDCTNPVKGVREDVDLQGERIVVIEVSL